MKLVALTIIAMSICYASVSLANNVIAPELVVYKKERKVELYSNGKILKVFPVGLGLNPVPPKENEGDNATPEGVYKVCGKLPKSSYHKALILNYPNLEDANRGLKNELISKIEFDAISQAIQNNKCPPFKTRLGGEIEIHGMGSQVDWTWGCIALDNPDVEELYQMLPNGTVVTIKP